MKTKNDEYHDRMMLAVKDADDSQMLKVISDRTAYIEKMEDMLTKKEALEFFLIKDQEAYGLLQQKRMDIQNILMNQHNQQNIINKYEKF